MVYENSQDYRMITKVKGMIEYYRDEEEKRLIHNMRVQQMKELAQVEMAHHLKFKDFSRAWDTYLEEFEHTAMVMISDLKATQQKEQQQIETDIVENQLKNIKWSKKVVELKK